MITHNSVKIDLSLAQQFITGLTGSQNALVTFQVFHDDKNISNRPAHWTSDLTGSLSKLISYNKEGQGIFVTVSETDGKGRAKHNIVAPRALFLDFDIKDGQFIDEAKMTLLPTPSAKVISGGGCHLYWFLKPGEPLEALEPALEKLIAYTGTDKACKDKSRVMRLPGFLHQKAEIGKTPDPFLVSMDYCNADQRYTIAEVLSNIPNVVPEEAKTPPEVPNVTKATKVPNKKKGTFEKMLAACVDQILNCEEGGRNVRYNKAVCTMAGRFPDRRGDVYPVLTEVARDIGLDAGEIEATFKSAWNFGTKKLLEGKDDISYLEASKLLIREVLTDVKYVTDGQQWWVYNGNGLWTSVNQEDILAMCQKFLETKTFVTGTYYITEALGLAKPYIQVAQWTPADNSRYISFSNGVLDLKSNILLEHNQDYMLDWQLSRPFDKTLGKWDGIKAFLDTLTQNDTGLYDLVIALCNAVLKGRADLQKAFHLFGSGGNGKGVLLNLLEMLVGTENTHSTSMHELNNNRFESANLRSKRLVIMPDEDRYSGKVEVFKSATGGNSIKYERKGKDASTFKFQGVMVCASNKQLFQGNNDGGVERRMITIPCNAVINAEDRVDLTPVIRAEMSAFTQYLLSLEDDWVSKTIYRAEAVESVRGLKEELEIRGDSVAAFYHENLEPCPGSKLACKGLYQSYRQYCEESGLNPKGMNNFSPDLVTYCNTSQKLIITREKTRDGRYIVGLKPRS